MGKAASTNIRLANLKKNAPKLIVPLHILLKVIYTGHRIESHLRDDEIFYDTA
jgi:hypothetical protein